MLSQLSYSPVRIGRYRACRGLVKDAGLDRSLSRGVLRRWRARVPKHGSPSLDPPRRAPRLGALAGMAELVGARDPWRLDLEAEVGG